VKHIGTLGAARIGRNDAERFIRQTLDIVDKQWGGCERYCGVAKGVLERGRVVHVEGDHGIGPHRFETGWLHKQNFRLKSHFCPPV
jgi:hypothetical protein